MVLRAVLRGYVLEEFIAYLLRDNGYRLLTSPLQDREALCGGGNGLRVHGRGADHQADALGELTMPTPFMLPVRLFCEAKYETAPVGLGVARNALGVLNDVNERFGSVRGPGAPVPLRRYQYRYTIFSASGFTRDAEAFALAQQISVVDLRGPAFAYLLVAARRVTDAVLAWQRRSRIGSTPVNAVRVAMRTWLDTSPEGEPPGVDLDSWPGLIEAVAASVGDEVRRREFWLGFPSAPFILALQPDDPRKFRELLGLVQIPLARLQFRGVSENNGSWALSLTEESGEEVVVRFGLPGTVDSWILAASEDERARVFDVKRFLKSIVVFEGAKAVELQFAPLSRRSEDELVEPALLRREAFRPDAVADATGAPGLVPGRWTGKALHDLLRLLDDEEWPQAEMIRLAIRNGGVITRPQVLEFPEYRERRRLTGITKPVRRLTRRLQSTGQLPYDAMPALTAEYGSTVWAQGFRVPDEFLSLGVE